MHVCIKMYAVHVELFWSILDLKLHCIVILVLILVILSAFSFTSPTSYTNSVELFWSILDLKLHCIVLVILSAFSCC